MKITPEDLQKMTDEEVSELNRVLALKIFKRFLLLQIAKWVFIFGVTHALKKYIESLSESPSQK